MQDDNLLEVARALRAAGKFDAAENLCHKILTASPQNVEALSLLGTLCFLTGRSDEGFRHLHLAVAADPGYAIALYNLAKASYELKGDIGRAERYYRAAVATRPDYHIAWNGLGNMLTTQGRFADAIECYRTAISSAPVQSPLRSALLMSQQYDPDGDIGKIHAEHEEWGRLIAAAIPPRAELLINSPDPGRKLRIGYVSADFRKHPVGYFLAPVLPCHDKSAYSIYCYSLSTVDDEITAQLRSCAQVWRQAETMSDEQLARQIRADRIDILIDLAGHSNNHRLGVFAEKPAPLQATWAGYVGTTGLATMDYLIADSRETPPGVERFYTEKIIRLPDCYVCYAPPGYAPEVASLPLASNGYPTFGCFNNLCKLNDRVVDLWSRLLQDLPGSRLLLKTAALNDPYVAGQYREKFAAKDIDPGRIELLGASPHRELLGSYGRIDIALDPFPYSGGLTTLEALWMGVPVITLGGDRFCSRHSLSHLTAVGRSELIAASADDYLRLATDLVRDPERLAAMRRDLREEMRRSPLCDGARFTRNLEYAFRTIWEEWCGERRP